MSTLIAFNQYNNFFCVFSLTPLEYYEQDEILKLRASYTKKVAIDLSYIDVKCEKIHVTLNRIGSIFFQSQTNFV